MPREQLVLQRLTDLIQSRGLKPGDRLPAERRLSVALGVSRNTLRGVLRMLEARGLVRIKRGSGCYLRTRISSSPESPLKITPNPEKLMADQLEAAFLVIPSVVEQAASRIGERQLAELQRCSVDLSRGIFKESSEKVWAESLTFFRLVAMGTGNDFLLRAVEQVCSSDMATYDIFFTIEREEREAIFADHVKMLNALRARDAEWARQVAEDYILRLCRILEEREGVAMTDLVYGAMGEQEDLHARAR